MRNQLLLSIPSNIFTKDRRFFGRVPKDINDILYVVKNIDLNDAKSYEITYDDTFKFIMIDDVDPGDSDIYDIIPDTTSNGLTFVIYTKPFIDEKENYGLYAKVLRLYEAIFYFNNITNRFVSPFFVKFHNTIAGKFINIGPQMFAMKTLQELVPGFSKADVLKYYGEYDVITRIKSSSLDTIFATSLEDILKGAAWSDFENVEQIRKTYGYPYKKDKDDDYVTLLKKAGKANTAQTFKE